MVMTMNKTFTFTKGRCVSLFPYDIEIYRGDSVGNNPVAYIHGRGAGMRLNDDSYTAAELRELADIADLAKEGGLL